MDNLVPYVSQQLQNPLKHLNFIHKCLGRNLTDEQGYLASGLQLYGTNDITIKENIMVRIQKLTGFKTLNCLFAECYIPRHKTYFSRSWH